MDSVDTLINKFKEDVMTYSMDALQSLRRFKLNEQILSIFPKSSVGSTFFDPFRSANPFWDSNGKERTSLIIFWLNKLLKDNVLPPYKFIGGLPQDLVDVTVITYETPLGIPIPSVTANPNDPNTYLRISKISHLIFAKLNDYYHDYPMIGILNYLLRGMPILFDDVGEIKGSYTTSLGAQSQLQRVNMLNVKDPTYIVKVYGLFPKFTKKVKVGTDEVLALDNRMLKYKLHPVFGLPEVQQGSFTYTNIYLLLHGLRDFTTD